MRIWSLGGRPGPVGRYQNTGRNKIREGDETSRKDEGERGKGASIHPDSTGT